VVCAAGMVCYHLGFLVPKILEVRAEKGLGNGYAFGDDFYPVWLTTREGWRHHRDPYSPEMTREIQTGLFGRPLDGRNPLDPPAGYREFAYPAYVDILFWPAAGLPYPAVRIILGFLLPLTTAAGIILWLWAMRFRPGPAIVGLLLLLTLCSYEVLEALFAEQLGLVVGFLVAASMAALVAGKYVTAGTLLALSTIKPQMVVLLIFFLLLWSTAKWRERRGLAMAFVLTQALLCGAALVVWPRWIQHWVSVLFDYRSYSVPPLTSDLFGPGFGAIFGAMLAAVLVGTGIAVAWRVRACSADSPEFLLALSLLLAITSVALVPGHAFYDHVVLLPGIILMVRFWRRLSLSQRPVRWMLFITTAVLCWQWLAATALVAIHPLISAERFDGALGVPIRMIGPFPLVLLALLAVMTRQALRGNLKWEI